MNRIIGQITAIALVIAFSLIFTSVSMLIDIGRRVAGFVARQRRMRQAWAKDIDNHFRTPTPVDLEGDPLPASIPSIVGSGSRPSVVGKVWPWPPDEERLGYQ